MEAKERGPQLQKDEVAVEAAAEEQEEEAPPSGQPVMTPPTEHLVSTNSQRLQLFLEQQTKRLTATPKKRKQQARQTTPLRQKRSPRANAIIAK